MGLLDWFAERVLGDLLDRTRLKAWVVLDGTEFSVHVENGGRSQTSINALGYRTDDGGETRMRTGEELPLTLPGRSERILHPGHYSDLAYEAVRLRKEGRAITGFWLRALGQRTVEVKVSEEDLQAINALPEPGPMVAFV